MIWIAILLLALAAMVPLVATLLRPVVTRGRREADLALYRAQLEELDREAAAGRLEGDALRAAQVEVQRRLFRHRQKPHPPRAAGRLAFCPWSF
jgi:cytochrome c-type biogenesis protein CcmH